MLPDLCADLLHRVVSGSVSGAIANDRFAALLAWCFFISWLFILLGRYFGCSSLSFVVLYI